MAIINDTTSDIFSYLNNSIVMLSGPGSSLTFDGCMGDTAVVMGTNELVGAGKDTHDSAIYDFGKGTQFTFYELGSQPMTFADLRVNTAMDATYKVWIETQFGQAATVTNDGRGGAFLSTGDGMVDFVGTSVANLKAHITPTNV